MDILSNATPSLRRPPMVAPTPSSRRSSAALTELLDFPAGLLSSLPEPLLLRLKVAGAPVPVYFATYPLALDPPVLADSVTFDRAELFALLQGVEADRTWHADFLGFCFEKWRSPGFRVTAAEALAGANPDAAPHWTLARALRRLQAELVGVELVNDCDSLHDAERSDDRAHQHLSAAA